MFMMLPKGTCLLITFGLAKSAFSLSGEFSSAGHLARIPHLLPTIRGRALQLEIKFDGRAIALAVVLLLLAGCGYFGWQTFRSGLELREQTQWIKAIATGTDVSDLNIPSGDRYGVMLMAQMAKTSGLSESDWRTFEIRATDQLRDGALYMAGSFLIACLAIERAFRKSLPKRDASGDATPAGRIEPASTDHQQDA